MKFHLRLLTCVLGLLLGGIGVQDTVLAAGSQNRLRVLILSGKNNHDWMATTPALKKIYEDSGRFSVDVETDPSRCTSVSLKAYDAIASNWTNFPSEARDWGKTAEEAILDFVRSGKGFVAVHAAGAAFPAWPDFQALIGATWGKETGHGTYHAFSVEMADRDHPVTRVVGDFSITDELWHRLKTDPAAHVLCRAYSDEAEGGTGRWEPVAFTTSAGRGRGFYLVLGHDVPAMMNPSWIMLLLRGTEWAAMGTAGLEIPFEASVTLRAAASYKRGESRERLSAIDMLAQAASRNPALKSQLARNMVELLDSDATDDFKNYLCGPISLVATAADVPGLIKRLGNEKSGFPARLALERIPGDDVLKALRESIPGLSGKPLAGVINTLGERKDARSVPILGRFLKSGQDPDAAAAAIQALGKIGGADAAALLASLPPARSERLAALRAESLIKCAEGFESSAKTGEAARIYNDLARAKLAPALRAAAFLGAVRCSGGAAGRMLLDAFSGGDEDLRSAVLRSLDTPAGKGLAKPVATRLPALPEFARPPFLYALADLGDRSLLPEMIQALDSGARPVRVAALYGVGLLGDSSSLERLSRMIEGADPVELAAIRKCLGRLDGAGVDERLIEMTGVKAAPAVRREMIAALAIRGVRPGLPAVMAALHDADARVRMAALKAAGALAGIPEIPRLVQIFREDRPADETGALERALLALGRRAQDQVIEACLAELPISRQAGKESLLTILGGFGGDQAHRAVGASLGDADPDVRNAAIRALGDWPDGSALADLMEIARSSGEAVPKALALRGVANLLGKDNHRTDDEKAGPLEAALGYADTVESRRLLLSALGRIASLKSLRLAVSYLDRPDVVDEAGLAVIQISRAVRTNYPADVREALGKVLSRVKTPSVVSQVEALLKTMEKWPGTGRS